AAGAPPGPAAEGPLSARLLATKERRTVDPADVAQLDELDELLERADAVVWSRGTSLAAHPSLTPAALRADHPHLTVTTVTPFGLEGPWADRPATELTVQAWSGGVIGLGRGAPDRPPVHVGGQVGEWLTGAQAAAATLV